MTKLLDTKQAAKYLGVSAAFLERDRWAGAKIPFVKIGTRSIRYRLSDLDEYIESKVRTNTFSLSKFLGGE
ncbi:MAG: DNA-binding protein [Gammaproteobacteria bacterium]|nr:DNA-binding protein [Gammaproteobacteria bacterium]